MSGKKLIAGNWKMNGLQADGKKLAKDISNKIKAGNFGCDFLVCPPFTLLKTVKTQLWGSRTSLGAQDVSAKPNGAHTGDISAQMLADMDCSYVIVGHSERRTDHGETDAVVCQKAKAAHDADLISIICVGETEAQRDAGKTVEVCRKQVNASVPEDSRASNTVIAYEPIWAIGTGKTPTAADVEEVHAAIRKTIAAKLGKAVATKMRILYGGSVKPNNAAELLALPDVDGALVGGASLKADDFIAIAQNAYGKGK